jgi:polar amino acid transport system substrate-binding protein
MRGTRLWLVIAMIAALFATALVAGCGDDDDDEGDATEETTGTGTADFETIEEGILTVGTDAPYPPFLTSTPDKPDFSGYEVELFNAIAEDLGYEVEYTNTGFNTIFRDTANGLFDTAVASSTIDTEREQVVDFTNPHYSADNALLVTEDSDIASIDDLDGAIVGTQDGTTQEKFANNETDAAEVRGFPQGPDAISALVTGQVEAVIIEQPVAADAVEKQGGIEIVEELPTGELFGFAVAPDNDGLREALNASLETLKEDGTMDELYEEYFATTPPEEIAAGSTNELLTND